MLGVFVKLDLGVHLSLSLPFPGVSSVVGLVLGLLADKIRLAFSKTILKHY